MKLIFFIAFRYLWNKKNNHSISFILYISLLAFIITSVAMLLIMSVFSGFREMYLNQVFQINPDLQIEAKNQKTIPHIREVYYNIKKNLNVEYVSRVIEEKVYLTNQDKNQVVILRSVDNNYNKIIPVDSLMYLGKYPNFLCEEEMVVSLDLFHRMMISLDREQTSVVYMPKKGKGFFSNPKEALVSRELYTVGVLNETFLNTIIAPIKNAEYLLEIDDLISYILIIKVKKNKNLEKVKEELQKILGKEFLIKTRFQQDDSYIKITNIEQLFTYMIFVLIILLSSFNLAGAIIVLIIDKKKQNLALRSMGMSDSKLKIIYFVLGLLITFISSILGIIIGCFIILIQFIFPITITGGITYPMKIEFFNILLVFFTLMVFGTLVSWIASRKLFL